ncbi:MAG: 3-dehydroquinate synthase [SAR324 cluster bacterium]|nr:3-dehydroquinate synthase [SAR324 cluster bacterium]
MQTVEVQIPGYEYTIHIGTHILDQQLPQAVRQFGVDLIVVVTNTTIHELYPFCIQQCLEASKQQIETCILPDGEQYKNLDTLNQIYDFLLKKRANRKTLVIAFGGGVIGDMAGFAAATFMRGVPYIQVPTTLLADVDSSIGGKTAVNHSLGKNTIGAFKQPVYVCMELNFLKTLEKRELIAGFFELMKHGIIHDAQLFTFLKNHQNVLETLDFSVLEEAIEASCRIKANVVEQDEKEQGWRATLNFGHTLGHFIETHTNYTSYLHGEAVGTGMVFAAFASRELGFLSEAAYQDIVSFLQTLACSIQLPALNYPLFKDLILHDKKANQQAVDFILIRNIGECFIHNNTSPELIWELFQKFIDTHPWACQVITS